MNRPVLLDLARKGGPLWQRACEFNFTASRGADPSRLPAMPAPLLAALNASPRAARRLSRQLLTAENIAPAPWLDFSEGPNRLALLEAPLLVQLIGYAGAAIFADRLARIIEGAKLREMRQALGGELMTFALQRASYFHRPPAEIRARHQDLPEKVAEICTAIENAGQDCLEVCLAGSSTTLTQRFVLRFPKSCTWKLERAAEPALRQKTWSFLHRLLTQELAPESSAWLS